MLSSEQITGKAREIAYALVRVSFYIKRSDLQIRIERSAFELLEQAARVSVDSSAKTVMAALSSIAVLDALVRLAHSIYEIEPVNATILVRELDALHTAIRQTANLDERLPNLETFFSQDNALPNGSEEKNDESASDANMTKTYGAQGDQKEGHQAIAEKSEATRPSEKNQALNIALRQSSIIETIRSGADSSRRLKDILSEFNDVSERTIRYDLQKLCERGVIERVGNGGPATYYRIPVEVSVQ
ncbi:DeoR family transcriptional regulator [Patescibacteria group bacterium]|nr:DeoR family transcriptional regulator [Patescibacteria group bacterium]